MISFITGTTSLNDTFPSATIEEAAEYCRGKDVLGVDVETEGMDFTCKKMVMFQIGDEERQFVIDVRFVSIEPLRDVLESKSIVKIAHNVKFDYKFIRAAGIMMNNVYCTYLAEKVITCGLRPGYGLAALCKRYLSVDLDKSTRNQFIDLGGRPFTDKQIKYGADDVIHLCRIRRIQMVTTEQHCLQKVVDLENRAVLAFADMEYEGMDVVREDWMKLAVRGESEADTMRQELDRMLLEDSRLASFKKLSIQGDLFIDASELRKVAISWDSPKQVLNVFRKIEKTLSSVDAKELHKYRRTVPIFNQYILYKEQMKLVSSYGRGFFKVASSDGRIRTDFNQIVDTGRTSSSEPNMQNIPGTNEYRNCFRAPEGWVFVSSDYSSQELNVIAFGSKDPVWLAALERGEDLHSVCAELVFGQVWTDAAEPDCEYMKSKQKCNCKGHKSLRTGVKSINFGLAYGMSEFKLADQMQIPVSEAKDLITSYFSTFPAIKGFLEMLAKYGVAYGYIKTFPPYERKRWFPDWFKGIRQDRSAKGILGSIERRSKNTPIQGASADVTKLAMIMVRDYIMDNDLMDKVRMVMTVHDQIDTVAKREYAEEWKVIFTHLMEEAALVIVTNGLLKADTNISERWEK